MNNFAYFKATSAADALKILASVDAGQFLAGGTNLVDLMRQNIARPDSVVDISGLPDGGGILERENGDVTIGAAVKNSAVAASQVIRRRFPVLAQAILYGASGQIRNMASVGGNMMQRTRCAYFYDHAARCNKRSPGDGCDAMDGFNRMHAILGASSQCIATHPSDMCVALAALGATVNIEGAQGKRDVPFVDFHRLPGDTPQHETLLEAGELIASLTIPRLDAARHSVYRKVRDRSSYAFALVSVAAILEIDRGTILTARLALGGVAHKPWRAHAAEQILTSGTPGEDLFRQAAEETLADARGFTHNAFKIELAKRLIVSTLSDLAGKAAQQ